MFKPKVFISGISGFLGQSLAQALQKDFLVTGCYFSNPIRVPNTQIFPINPKNPEVLETIVRLQAPDFIINASGIHDRKKIDDQPKLSDQINIVEPVSLAILSHKIHAKFIQISCSSIFDGSQGNYREKDTSFTMDDSLGKQKIAAESFIRAQTIESTILRVGSVVGAGPGFRNTKFDSIRKKIAKNESIEISHKKIHSFLSSISFAQGIRYILLGQFPTKHRIFHLGGAKITEADFVKNWLRIINKTEIKLHPPEEDKAKNLSLDSSLFEEVFSPWKAESQEQLYLNLISSLAPGLDQKKFIPKNLSF
ncbi:MAG: sugar nucleotide-binding protein [Oligoflexia bacterium]|nr:sugar nucleotide-binding protein [Oligoflexia bacterium]